MEFRRLIQRLTGLSRTPGPRSYLNQSGSLEAAISETFAGKMRFQGCAPILNGPLVCMGFTNRSGSNLLAAYLRACPPLAGFGEDLNPSSIRARTRAMNSQSLPDFLCDISARSADKAVVGFKTSFEQLRMLYRNNIPAMYTDGVKLIEIRREDLVAQAISYQIALQTGAWSSRIKTSSHPDPVCDPEALHSIIQGLTAAQTRMDILVERHLVDRLIVRYEDLVLEPDEILQKIGRFLGFDARDWKAERPPLERQANSTNDAFRAAFRRYLRQQAPD